MAKVLACPSCGHKHSLEDIDSSDSFACHECSKTLAVPNNAKQFMKISSPEAAVDKKPVDRPRSEAVVDNNQNGIVVVARSSLDFQLQSQSETRTKNDSGIQVVGKSGSPNDLDEMMPSNVESPTPKPQSFKSQKTSLKHPISLLGKVITWLIAIPVGFIFVVIIPRILGFGFHASDFIGVITTQGLGRFKIVFMLVILWSIATTLSLPVLQAVWQKIFNRSKAVS